LPVLNGLTQYSLILAESRIQLRRILWELLPGLEPAPGAGVSFATVKQWILAGKLITTKTPGGFIAQGQGATAN
jgi:hypothetical protein